MAKYQGRYHKKKDLRAVIAISRNSKGEVLRIIDGVCLGSISSTYNDLSKNEGSWVEIFHNHQIKEGPRSDYYSPGYVFKNNSSSPKNRVFWTSKLTKKVQDILSQSQRWGMFFDRNSPECILIKGRYGEGAKFRSDKFGCSSILFLYSLCRYYTEHRTLGYGLIHLYKLNEELKLGLTVDQMILWVNAFRVPYGYKTKREFLNHRPATNNGHCVHRGHRFFDGYIYISMLESMGDDFFKKFPKTFSTGSPAYSGKSLSQHYGLNPECKCTSPPNTARIVLTKCLQEPAKPVENYEDVM